MAATLEVWDGPQRRADLLGRFAIGSDHKVRSQIESPIIDQQLHLCSARSRYDIRGFRNLSIYQLRSQRRLSLMLPEYLQHSAVGDYHALQLPQSASR